MKSVLVSSSILLLALLSSLIHLSRGGEILFWITTASPSHYQLFKPLAMALARRNHTVTVVTPYPCPALQAMDNVRYIKVDTDMSVHTNSASVFKGGSDDDFLDVAKVELMNQEVLLANPDIRSLMEHSPAHFDVTVISAPLSCDLGLHLAVNHFRSPVILLYASVTDTNLNLAMGNPVNPSHMPAVVAPYGQVMTFWQRLHNAYMTVQESLSTKDINRRVGEKLKQLLNVEQSPDINGMVDNSSFAFFNAHSLFENVAPVNPNSAWIGGLHLGGLLEELPRDVEEFLDGATEGVILVTFGSQIKSSQLPEDKRDIFVNTFSKLRQRVIWKWESEGMNNLPGNVMLKKWLPQQEILAHKNVKLIITHGGFLSMQESLFHKVPMIILPGYFDQSANAARAEKLGFGKVLRWTDLDERTLMDTIQLVLTDSTFQAKADHYGHIFSDNPIPPLDLAVYHTEFIMRHRGAPHLRSPTKDLNWFQYFLLDVLAFLLSIVAFAIFLMYSVIKSAIYVAANVKQKEKKM